MDKCSCVKTTYEADVGTLEIICCEKGVHNIHIVTQVNPDYYNTENIQNASHSKNDERENVSNTIKKWLKSYFASSVEDIKQLPPVCPSVFSLKGNFTIRVWKTLMTKVEFGQTISYGQLAALSGNSAASRAVGSAMKHNCIPLIIPCHRVIKSDGKMGHFSGGKNVKEWLLNHENASFKT